MIMMLIETDVGDTDLLKSKLETDLFDDLRFGQ